VVVPKMGKKLDRMQTYFLWIALFFLSCRSAPVTNLNLVVSENTINYGLHDIWALRSVDGIDVGREQSSAYLEFNLTTGKVYGNTGCNSLTADLFVDTDTLRLMNTAITELFCDNFQQEQRYVAHLIQSMSYSVDGLMLTLKSNQAILIFKKVD